jgi:hypothetical protein
VFPGLSLSELELALKQSAFDLGATGADNVYGNGLIDVMEAYSLLLNPVPDLFLSPATHDFGRVKEGDGSSLQPFTITNQGMSNLTMDSLSITGPDASDFFMVSDMCSGLMIPPSEGCTVEIIFLPTSGGEKRAALLIPSNDPDQDPAIVTLQGRGIERFLLGVTVLGTGSGRVVSQPQGIDCGSGCSKLFRAGTIVTLQAVPEGDSGFGGWSGCTWSSGKTCQVIMGRDKAVTNTFIGPSLTVTAPSGGEVWSTGTLKKIKWAYTGRPRSYVKIELLRGEVWVKTIAGAVRRGTGGKGHYDWFVPKGLPAGNDYRIRITSTRNSATTDSSDTFFTILQ